ncbi:MAG: hypothetical protein Q9186_007493 [Xanthomendoza sp. 1 TL-2023]
MASSKIPLPTSKTLISRTRPRGSSDPSENGSKKQQQLPTLRRRSSLTSALYDSDYQQYTRDCFKAGIIPSTEPWTIVPAKPIDNLEQAIQAYYYAKYRLKLRKVSPRSKGLLPIYQQSLQSMIRDPSNRLKKVIANSHNKVLHSTAFLYKDPLCTQEDHIQAVEQLARLRYYADYGDYIAVHCNGFRQVAETQVEYANMLIGKDWDTVRRLLTREEEIDRKWRFNGRQSSEPPHPMMSLLGAVSVFSGMSFDNIQYCINWYADRNAKAHSGVSKYIKICDWEKLARHIWRDLQDVPHVFGEKDNKSMRKAVELIRDKFFDDLTAISHIASEKAEQLTDQKIARDKIKNANRRKDKEKHAKKLRGVEKKRNRRINDKRQRTVDTRRAERKSKAGTDSWEDVVDLGLSLDV